ncbi:MAG: hypothetical protein KAS96_08160 [Planctomycetes bacterium]|nr:hypothetical protein [Planctomycetota bacterium]
MNQRQRLMATLQGKPVDRPAVSFYEIGGFASDPNDPDKFNVYNSPSWRPLLQLAEEKTDIIRMKSAVRRHSHEAWDASQKNSSQNIRDEFFKIDQYIENNSKFTKTTVNIADKTLTSLTRRDPHLDTIWTLEHLLKNTDDIKAYLQLPDDVFHENIDITHLVEEDQALGDKGIIMIDTEDPICAVASLFSMEDFTILAFTEKNLYHQLLEKVARYIHKRTEKVAEEFPGHLWRIYGPEYVTEPYLPPQLFEEYVVRYTGPMVEMIEKNEGFARIHAHGKIKNILDYIVQMGASAIDPIEPPPQGDVELSYVREKYGKDLVLFGNIEIVDIENTPNNDFKKNVSQALIDGTKGQSRGFVLMPSASPYGRDISKTTMKNYETMVELTENFNG